MSQDLRKPRITATEEYEKNPDLKPEDIVELREWLKTQRHLPEISEEMLILFHHSCYFKLAATKDCIEMFYSMRSNNPAFFTNRDAKKPDLAKAMLGMYCAILPVPDPDGNLIVYYSLRDFEPSKYQQTEHMKVFCMAMDIEFLESGTRPGLVIVYNMEGMRLGHLARANLLAIKRFFVFIQEANPVRLKNIHLVNVIPFIDKVMTLVRPFLKKELLNLVKFHTSGMDDFYTKVPEKCLPKEIGGALDSVEVWNEKFKEKLISYADYFLEDEKMRVDESKREKRKKSKLGKEDPAIEFNKLEID